MFREWRVSRDQCLSMTKRCAIRTEAGAQPTEVRSAYPTKVLRRVGSAFRGTCSARTRCGAAQAEGLSLQVLALRLVQRVRARSTVSRTSRWRCQESRLLSTSQRVDSVFWKMRARSRNITSLLRFRNHAGRWVMTQPNAHRRCIRTCCEPLEPVRSVGVDVLRAPNAPGRRHACPARPPGGQWVG